MAHCDSLDLISGQKMKSSKRRNPIEESHDKSDKVIS